MSYILQALRKSEQGRPTPGEAPLAIATASVPEERSRIAFWLVLVLVALGVTGGAGYYFYSMRGKPAAVAVPAAPTLAKTRLEPERQPPVTEAPPAGAAPAPAHEAMREAPVTAEAPPALTPSPFAEPPRRGEVRDLAEQLRVPPPPRVAKATPPVPRVAGPEHRPGAPAPAAPPVARVDDGVKFLRAMPPEFQRELPALVVNIHIYAANEADRILYINNRQYQAGDRVREDIRIEAIVEDGAVLSFRGQRFKLPRPS